jgi:hypothetical protein
VSFVKVAEFQRRGVVHFHGLIRLDGPGDFDPPQIDVDTAALGQAILQAAAHVRLTVEMPDGSGLVLRFGEQLDTQAVNGGSTGELTPEHAARYIAKFATKSAEDFGLGDRRISPETLPLLGVSDHVDRLVRLAWQLGEHESYDGLRRWVHMLAFRGHFTSKSRRYSTTLGAIRGERLAYRQRQAAEHIRELAPEENDNTLVVARWEFAGLGYLTTGDAAPDGGCALGMGEGSGEVVERGGGHPFGVGQLGGVAENGGGGLVVVCLPGVIGGQAVIRAAGGSVTKVLAGQTTSEGGDRREVAQQSAPLTRSMVAAQRSGRHPDVRGDRSQQRCRVGGGMQHLVALGELLQVSDVAVAARAWPAGSVAAGSSSPSMVRRLVTVSFHAESICGATAVPAAPS